MPQTTIFEVWRTKGIRRKLMQPVLKLKPEWFCLDGYFCIPGTKFFLCGFIMDHKPRATEINMFIQPLFGNEIGMNLGYADMLQGDNGIVVIKGRKPTIVADEFIAKVSPYIDEVMMRDSLDYFVKRIEKDTLYRNSRIRYHYGLALALQEKYEAAAMHLEEVATSEWEKRVVPEEAESASNLVSLLNSDPKSAFILIQKYIETNKAKLAGYLES